MEVTTAKRFRPPFRAKKRSVLVLADAVVMVPFYIKIWVSCRIHAQEIVDVPVAQHCTSSQYHRLVRIDLFSWYLGISMVASNLQCRSGAYQENPPPSVKPPTPGPDTLPPTTFTPSLESSLYASAQVYFCDVKNGLVMSSQNIQWRVRTSPIPSSTVDLSSDRLTCFMRAKEMCTPVVLEWPGFEA